MTLELFTSPVRWSARSDYDTEHQIDVAVLMHGMTEIAFATAEAPEDGLEQAQTFEAIADALNHYQALIANKT